MIEKSLLNSLVKKYVGLPFVESEGKDRFDCWVFFKRFWHDLGYEWEREYKWKEFVLRDEFSCGSDWELVIFPHRLDIVFFQNKKDYLYHCGIMLNSYEIIHCVKGIGVIVSDLTGKWEKRVAGIYRLKDDSCLFENN